MDATSIDQLEALLGGLVVPAAKTEITALVRVIDRLSARLALVVAEFDRSQSYRDDHAVSMAQWLCQHTVADRKSANAHVRSGRQLTDLPHTADAAVTGALSGGQLRAVLANVSNTTRPLFAEHEAELLPVLAPLTVRQTALAMGQWRARAEATLPGPEPRQPRPQTVTHTQSLGGRWHLTGTFDAEPGSVVHRALALYRDTIAAGDDRSLPEKNAEALDAIFRFFLDNQQRHLGGRHRPHVNVVIELSELEGRGQGRLLDGTVVDPATVKRLLCDAGLHRFVTRGRSTILDFGSTTRTIPAALYTALVLRDQHCRFPGCERPPEWCEGHHIHHWEDGGLTNLPNLGLFCKYHHHLIHKDGWTVELLPDGTMHFTDPNGNRFTTTLEHLPTLIAA